MTEYHDRVCRWRKVHKDLLALNCRTVTPSSLARFCGVSRERGRQMLVRMIEEGLARRAAVGPHGSVELLSDEEE